MARSHSLGAGSSELFKKILIANRGEIACRVIRTARRMGIATVAVYSDADARAPHVKMADESVRLGPAPASESYLKAELIIDACKATGAEAVHPGYGFLSASARASPRRSPKPASPSSARRPRPSPRWATRSQSKKLAQKAGVNIVPGHLDDIATTAEAVKIAGGIGYPVMIKASAGGGGKGMRLAWNEKDVRERLRQREARGPRQLRRRPRVHREIHRGAAPHRNPGARRPARQRALPRRARMLDPAPPPESRRGSAVAVRHPGDAQGDGRAGGRAGQGGRILLAPARSS